MSKKRRKFDAKFKTKVVLELLEGEETLNQIASKYEILPKSLLNWKKQFLENASLAFDKSEVVKEYKEKIERMEKEKERLAKKLVEVVVERDCAVGKLESLDLSIKRKMIDKNEGVQADNNKNPSQNRQLKLLGISKTAHYYTPMKKFSREEDIRLLNIIDLIHTKHPYYGTRRIKKLLDRLGFDVGRKLIKTMMEFMGIKALYPKVKTTIANKEHKKYPYLLNEFKNNKGQVIVDIPNKIWSADITYVKLNKGFLKESLFYFVKITSLDKAYLAAIIDWNTKKILSWKLSNTMDVKLTTDVLKDALNKYSKPDIFNSDQGSQYTAKEHIEILTKNNISISMDAKGRSIDNIVMERFWRTIKYEDIYPSSYETIKEARDGIKKYMNIYNKERLHSSIDYLTPNEAYYKGANNRCYNAKKMLLEVA